MSEMRRLELAVSPPDGKLEPPIHRDGLILRSELLGQLAAVPDDVPLVRLVAPAGYGKTTTLSQWSTVDGRQFAWVTLDQDDGDPVRLAGQVSLALHRIEPLDPAVFRTLVAGDGSRHVAALPHLLASLRTWSRPGVLVRDDLHEVRGAAAVSFLRALVAGLPAGFHIATGSRFEPALGPGGGAGRSVEYGPDSLAFTSAEARAVLVAAGVACDDETVRTLVRRTEGWPVGVYLAALAIRAAPDAIEGSGGLAGDDPFVVDYFRDELLAHESPDAVRFLLRTAPLGQMCGSLCDHVLGHNGSARRLTEAARRNLFVTPLDRHGEWFRYHRLVAEMLLSELRRREPGEELRVHRLAAGWYEDRGRPEEAITHALASGPDSAAAELVNRHIRAFAAQGRHRTVRGRLEAVGDDRIAGYPPLAVTAAWLWAFEGDPLRAHRNLHAAERGAYEGPLPDGSTSLESAVTLLRAALGSLGVAKMLVDATAAVALEPPGGPWHPAARAMLGVALALNGDPDRAVGELEAAARLGADPPWPVAAAAAGELALLAAERNDWSRAQRTAARAVQLVETGGLGDQLFSALAFVAAARVAAHTGDRPEAQRYAGRALRLHADPSPAAFPWLSAQLAIALGRTFLDLGDLTAARHRAEEARAQLTRLLSEGVLRDQLRRLSADLARGGGHVRVPSAMALTEAEMRVLQLLQTHLSLGEIGDELYISRNTVKTQVAAVYRKLRCSTRTEAVRRGSDLGLLES
jgi:LuxR family maltose regulon positive regulatory protein